MNLTGQLLYCNQVDSNPLTAEREGMLREGIHLLFFWRGSKITVLNERWAGVKIKILGSEEIKVMGSGLMIYTEERRRANFICGGHYYDELFGKVGVAGDGKEF
jgi:hypothetical protein